jgi:hypothetical protein
MKKLLFGILFIGFTNLMCSQNLIKESLLEELAIANTITKSLNSNYLKEVNSKDTPIKVIKLENIVARYDIKEANVYINKVSYYDVVFKESSCEIIAKYNNSGELISTIETFEDIKLPFQLSYQISKHYPGWNFISNTHIINYTKENGVKKTYEVELKNGKTLKFLKFEVEGSEKNNYIASN